MTGEREQTTGGRRNRLRILSRIALAAAVLLTLDAARLPLRSSNALDELYYATVDSRCYDALELNLFTTDEILAALSPFKAPAVDLMDGVEPYYSTVDEKPLAHSLFGPGEHDMLEATYDCVTRYCCTDELLDGEEGLFALDWCVDDHVLAGVDNRPEQAGKSLRFEVVMPLSRFSDEFLFPPVEIEVELRYDLESKELREGDLGPISISGDDSAYDFKSYSRYLESHGISTEDVANAAVQAIEEQVLPRFLARGGSTSTHSADIEADGVTVDIDLSQLGQTESE